MVGLYSKIMGSSMRNHQTVFRSGCTILHSHQQFMRVIVAPYHSPAFGVVSVSDVSHSNRCAVLSHCCFNLYLFHDISYGVSFYVPICHLQISFGGVSVKIFGSFINWVVWFLIVRGYLLNFRTQHFPFSLFFLLSKDASFFLFVFLPESIYLKPESSNCTFF